MSTAADPSIHHQWLNAQEQEPDSKSYALSGKIMLASIIVLFVVVVFLVILHLYARWYIVRFRRRNTTARRNRRNRSTRVVFYVDNNTALSPPTGGLDASLLKSLPLFVYSSESDSDGNYPECAVCLSEFEDGETGRVLPKCKHCFHTECIDMWFHSHSTCPLCRSPVEPIETGMTILVDQQSPDSVPVPVPDSSTLLVRDETTSSEDRMKRIDIRIDVPTRSELATENEFIRLASPSQGFRSPGSRLLSLKKIISMSRKSPAVSPSSGVGPSCLPVAAESDIESVRQESAHDSTRSGTAVDFR